MLPHTCGGQEGPPVTDRPLMTPLRTPAGPRVAVCAEPPGRRKGPYAAARRSKCLFSSCLRPLSHQKYTDPGRAEILAWITPALIEWKKQRPTRYLRSNLLVKLSVCLAPVFFHSFTFCFVVNVCYSPPDQHSFGVFWRWTEPKLVKLSVTGQHVSIILLFQLNLFSLVTLLRDVMLLVKHLCLLSLYLLLQTDNRPVCSQSSQCSGLCLFTHNAIMKGDWTYGAMTRRG